MKATDDFLEIIGRNRDLVSAGGVVHSFTGTIEEMNKILNETEFYIGKLINIVTDDSSVLLTNTKVLYSLLFAGINGCSLKTKENLEVVKEIPLEKMMIETDCPWCEIKASHAGYSLIDTKFPTKKDAKKWETGHCIKGRSEPCHIVQVAEVIAKVKGIGVPQVANACFENSAKLFNFESTNN